MIFFGAQNLLFIVRTYETDANYVQLGEKKTLRKISVQQKTTHILLPDRKFHIFGRMISDPKVAKIYIFMKFLGKSGQIFSCTKIFLNDFFAQLYIISIRFIRTYDKQQI